MKRTVHVVVQTHWDREWYLPRVTTLARAQEVLALALAQLDDGRLPSFLFDGQTVAFADLLAVAEAPLAQALLRHARSGALVLGPWYVMADEFLVSGESLLRNLELGHADARRFGSVQAVGYLPDSFGHVAQMPEVLRQFGIGVAVLWRGADALHNTFDWQAPSGAVVGTVFLPEGYYQHPLNLADGLQQLPALLAKIGQRTPAGPLLLTQGGDHLAPAPALAQRLAAFNASQEDWQLEFCTLEQHVQAALAANPTRERIAGELRRNRSAFVLPDVLSTRRYLKRLHQQAEDRLLGETEPLLAYFWPGELPARALERCWRTLIEQQAHDSICGCSIDAVHREMAQRFVPLGQELDALRQATLQRCGATTALRHGPGEVFADDRRFTLFNPLPVSRSGWWQLELFVRGEPMPAPQALQVLAEDGRVLPSEVLRCEPTAELVSPLDDFPERIAGHRVTLALRADLPGLGALPLRCEDAGRPPARREVTAIDNGCWRVALDDQHQLVLTDLRSRASGALALHSELDAGDSYNFSPPPVPHLSQARRWQLQDGCCGEFVQTLRLTIELRTPAALDASRQGAASGTVVNRGELVLQLRGDSPDLHVTLDWDNRAQDQRTRLLLPFAPEDGTSTGADSAFAWIERPVAMAQIPEQPSRQEMAPVVMPSLSAIGAGRWALAHEAMQEFEVQCVGDQRWLALTLVRSVGWLSRRDLRTRGVGAGPDIPTPDAQCLHRERFRFVLRARGHGESLAPAALAAAADLRRPPLLLRGHATPRLAPLDIGNTVVQTSSLRRVDGRLELRLWNPSTEVQRLRIDPQRWSVVRADGQPDAAPADQVPPQGLLTLRERR